MGKELRFPLTGARAQDSFYFVTADRWIIEGVRDGVPFQVRGADYTQDEWEQKLAEYADKGYDIIYTSPAGRRP